ncbi:unnamed protein product [Anisakis simplex]|uniref:dolichyl-phosphate-mannose--protein mannosyltransferase n=1 Tax=Anisakis simplex TaxID=6269 RepID=A0A0M3JYH0_ANISI|nr:unnamed protein product [Anisakis simplex]
MLSGSHTITYHSVNVMLHCAVTVLVYYVLRDFATIDFECKRPTAVAFYAALIFAVHPVANIVGRAELLMATFMLMVIKLYIGCIKRNYFTSLDKSFLILFAFMALLSKEQGIATLPVCAIIDLLSNGFSPYRFCDALKQRHLDKHNNNRSDDDNTARLNRYLSSLARATQCAVATALMLLIRLHINAFKSPNFSAFDNPIAFHPSLFYRIVNYWYLILLNLWLLVYPSKLCFDYSMGCISVIESLCDYRFYITILFVAILAFAIYKCSTSHAFEFNRLICFGLAIGLLTFLPASNLFVTVGFVIAERVLYLPSLGFCILMAVAFEKLQNHCFFYMHNERFRFVAFILLLLAATKSMKRCAEWKTELELYRSGLDVCPSNAKIHYNLGKVLADSGDPLTAENSYKSAIRQVTWIFLMVRRDFRLNPSYDHAMNNLANIYLLRRRYEEAEKLLRKCVEIRPSFAAAWMNLGLALLGQRKYKESEESFRVSLSIRPNYADCLYNMGNLYLQQNEKHSAESIWRNVTRIQPNHERAWVNLLVLLDEVGDCEEVIELGDDALKHLKNNSAIHFQIGTCFGKMKLFEEAEEHLRKAIVLHADNALYWTNLAILYQRWNRIRDAINAYRISLKLQPNLKSARENLENLIKNSQKSFS